MPEDIILNIDEKTEAPPCPYEGHKWGKVIHNHEVQWVASYKDSINGKNKYVMVDPSSSIRGNSDLKKFDKARKLHHIIDKIRKTYMEDIKSKTLQIRQRATALYLIDKLALRVGNKKGKNEADTVGCCSLRKEHVKLHKPNKIEFQFLGKDSIEYHNTIEVIPQVFKNFKIFLKDKSTGDMIFEKLSVTSLNKFLNSQMKGLTAKVFRTYNASICMQKELEKYDMSKKDSQTVEEKLLFFNRASIEVAILCNHQRTVSKTHDQQLTKIQDQIKQTMDEIKYFKHLLKCLKNNKKPTLKPPWAEEDAPKKLPTNEASTEKKITQLQDRKRKLETKLIEKDETKAVATSTSKINYIDPRITIAWSRKVGLPLTKVFSAAVRRKFPWAVAIVDEKPDFKF